MLWIALFVITAAIAACALVGVVLMQPSDRPTN
jgi:preprotein translocase subunit SecG